MQEIFTEPQFKIDESTKQFNAHLLNAVMVCPEGFEPSTSGVGVLHSIQMSYGHIIIIINLIISFYNY